mgnify:CR=1 FL=1
MSKASSRTGLRRIWTNCNEISTLLAKHLDTSDILVLLPSLSLQESTGERVNEKGEAAIRLPFTLFSTPVLFSRMRSIALRVSSVSPTGRSYAPLSTHIIFSSSVKNFAVIGESGNQIQYARATTRVMPPVKRKKTRQGLKALSSPICRTAYERRPDTICALSFDAGADSQYASETQITIHIRAVHQEPITSPNLRQNCELLYSLSSKGYAYCLFRQSVPRTCAVGESH